MRQTTPRERPSRPLRAQGKAVPEDARRHNRRLVLQSLFGAGELSRADLARATRLTPATVSDLVGELLGEGLIEEVGRRQGQIGKPSTLVAVVPDSRHVVCLDLSGDAEIRGALVNLLGKVVTERTVARRNRTGPAAAELVGALVAELVEQATSPLLGVGVGTPGVIDERGRVLQAPNLDWSGLDLRSLVAGVVDLPVHVGNDANVAALAEFTFGAEEVPNLLVVKIGLGVGAGLVINGQALIGDRFAAGEIGHVVVDERGPACACGKRGCLETYFVPVIHTPAEDPAEHRRLAVGAGRRLGIALAPVVSAFDIRHVAMSAPEQLLGEPFRRAVVDTVRRRTLASVAADLQVRYTANGEQDVLLGAAVLVLSEELGVA